MALDGLLRRAVPLEWWDNRPPHKWAVLATVAGLVYVGGLLAGDGELVGLVPAIGAVWLVLVWAHVAVCVELPPVKVARVHHAACVLYALPVVVAVLGVFLFGVIVCGGIWAISRI